jgi:parallel beta-helix repeat protein
MKRVAATLFLIIILMIPVAGLVSNNLVDEAVTISHVQNHILSQYQTSAPINITSNSDFVAAGASGTGTPVDPYVFENLAISTQGTSISIQNTTAYFIIYNCILESGDTEPAIQFNNVENGQVILVEISGGNSGIEITNSQDISVSNASIYGSWNGISLNTASNSTVTYSRVFNNYRGMLLWSSSYCQISNNSIYSNTENGIELTWFSHNNTILGNSIGWNGITDESGENAADYGADNHFDDGVSIGNSWSDFNGTTPYEIVGSSGAIDSYPELLEDTEAPVVSRLFDMVIDVETNGNLMTWIASDEFPQSYSIRINGELVVASVWNGGDITVDLDSLEEGSHTYILTLYDGVQNTTSDQVIVNAVLFVLGGIGTELVMIASGITVVFFVVIILLIKRMS